MELVVDCGTTVILVRRRCSLVFLRLRTRPGSTLFPYTTLFRSAARLALRHLQFCRCYACIGVSRSEEHTSELQSLRHLVCRLLLEKKKRSGRKRAQSTCCGQAPGWASRAGSARSPRSTLMPPSR